MSKERKRGVPPVVMEKKDRLTIFDNVKIYIGIYKYMCMHVYTYKYMYMYIYTCIDIYV